MKRVSCYITEIRIRDGLVLHSRPGQNPTYLKTAVINKNWLYRLSTDLMVPDESFNLKAAGEVLLRTLTEDSEEGQFFYDLNQEILTDKLIRINVRQFITDTVYSIDGGALFKGFVLADLEF
jgi:hypothetical protein